MDGRTNNSLLDNRYVFSQEEFKRMMIKYDQAILPERIRHVMLRNSIPGEQAFTRKLYLYWTDAELHLRPICVRFSLSKAFQADSSHAFNDQNLAQLITGFNRKEFKAKQKYLNIEIEEIGTPGQTEDQAILSLWVTLDSFLGGIGYLHEGYHFNVREVLRIYGYFAEFLQIENTFVCDNVELTHPMTQADVPIRLISALATDKTWLQANIPHLKLVDVRHFSVTATDAIHQNAATRQTELEELQKLTLDKWYDMLDTQQRTALTVLYEHLFPKRRSSTAFFKRTSTAVKENIFGEETIQSLAAAAYKEVEDKLQITNDFKVLHELLTGHSYLQFGNIPLNRNSNDFWVKSRVQRLLWGSYVWHQDGVGKNPASVIRHAKY